MDLKQFFSIFKRWLWLLILGAVLGAGLGYYFSSRQTPIYQASSRFVVLRAAQTTYDYFSYIDSQQFISTYAQLLTTESLLYQASQDLGFPVNRGQASAQQIGETQFVELTVRDTNPEKAAIIANGLVKVLIEQNEQLQSVRYDSAEKNLQDRIDNAQEQIHELEVQISELSATVNKEQIKTVQDEIDAIQTQINDLQSQLLKIDPLSQLPADIAQKNALQSKIDELNSILSLYQNIYTELVVLGQTKNSEQITPPQLEQLKTTLSLYQQIYLSSIGSLEALRLAKAQNAPNVVQVERAVTPSAPISPKPRQTALMTGAIGLLLTGFIAFMVEYFDDTVKTPDDVKEALDLPVIGYIADLKKNDAVEESHGMFVAKQPRSPVAEAFRSLRTNLEYSSIDNPLRVVLVSSSGESEGKSTISSNLAIVEAQSGKRVLILDADMRRPKVHTMFNKTNRIGLTDVLTGKLTINDVVRPIEQIQNLDIITCGTLPPNPSELLGSDRMYHLLQELREMYDFIIIDTPPMIVADSQVLANKVDGIIFVLIPGQTRFLAAEKPLEELRRIDANIVGVVMNRIPKNRDYYYGGYNYYSPYSSKTNYYKTAPYDMSASPSIERQLVNSSSSLVQKEKNPRDKG